MAISRTLFLGLCCLAGIQEFWLLHLRRGPAAGARKDRGSFWVIILGSWLVVGLSIAAAALVPGALIFRSRPAGFWAGAVLVAAAALLRRHSIQTLGRDFNVRVTVREGQPVIQTGAYRWIRHPSYLAGIILFAGIAVAMNNWASVAVMLGALPLLYLYRIRVEEHALLEAIGKPYRDYMARTKRLIPFVY